jgi:hypothetical protein
MRFFHFLSFWSIILFSVSCSNNNLATEDENILRPKDSTLLQTTEVSTQRIDDGQFTYRVVATGKLQSLSDYTVVQERGRMMEYYTFKTFSRREVACCSATCGVAPGRL